MRTLLFTGTALLLLTACAADVPAEYDAQPAAMEAAQQPARLADHGPDHHILVPAAEIAWRAGPGSLAAGAEFAVLEGDPSQEGVFTMRIRMPDGFHIAPHSHPNVERVTVLSGVFNLGTGETVDRAATRPLHPGTYASMPPGMTHYVFTEGETEIQLTSVGPWVINYVNPDDDPRNH
jgi:quercetin dioxygenase-like cupin family protein